MSVFNGNSGGTPGFSFTQPQNGRHTPKNNNHQNTNRPKRRNNNNSNNSSNGGNNHSSSNNHNNTNNNINNTGGRSNGRKPKPKSSSNQNRNSPDNDLESTPSFDVPKTIIPKQKADPLQNFTNQEKELTGDLFPNPQQFGYPPRNAGNTNRPPRPVPKYLLHQPRLLVTPQFTQNSWDSSNQQKMLNMEAQSGGKDLQGLYEEFQKLREIERKQMEISGLVDAENISKDLNDAISFEGSCLEMCPVFERVRRALENNVKQMERDPQLKVISPQRAIKAFSRPAAGQPPPLPSDVRPPHVLVRTLNYLIDNALPMLPELHSFIWDRTRSIRQDFTYQNFFGPEAIDCNEKIVRIHLLSLHIMAGSQQEYSQQQELEQFNKALQTLLESYQDIRNHGGSAPNEAEFRAFYLLSHIRDPEQEREIQKLPPNILNHQYVQLALMFRNILLQSNIVERGYNNTVGSLSLFGQFFIMITQNSSHIPFLMLCLLETHFNEIRFYALKSMSRSYHTKSKPYPAVKLQQFLGFDNVEQLIKFVTYYEVDTFTDEHGNLVVDLFNKDKLANKYKLNSIHDKPKLSPAYSESLNRAFPGMGSLRQLIDSGKSNQNLGLKSSRMLRPAESIQAPGFSSTPFAAPTSFATAPFASPAVPVPPTGSKSLSDFLSNGSVTTTPGGFGSATGFGASATSTATATASTTVGFGSSSNKPIIATPQSNSFGSSLDATNKAIANTFGKNTAPASSGIFGKKVQEISALDQPSVTSSTTVPSKPFQFGSATPTLPKLSQPSEQIQPPKITPMVDFSKPTKKATPFDFNSKPQLNHNPTSPVATGTADDSISLTASILVSSKPSSLMTSSNSALNLGSKSSPSVSKIIDSPHFKSVSLEIYQQILSSVISTELSKFLPNLLKQQHENIKRSNLIDQIKKETYTTMIDNILASRLQMARADSFYTKSLKVKIIKKLIKTGSGCMSAKELKERKKQELELILFQSKPKLTHKRTSSIDSNSSIASINSKRSRPNPINIEESQRSIQKLWEPINLQEFLNKMSSKIKVKLESKDIEFTLLLVVENWQTNYSKWLNNKLKLRVNLSDMVYEKFLTTDRLQLKLSSLPFEYNNKKYFTKTPFVIFECGKTTTTGTENILEKLQKDSVKVLKLISLLNGYSYYKVQLVLLYWDSSLSNLSEKVIRGQLQFDSLVSAGADCLQSIDICNMTEPNIDINEKLQNVFNSLSSRFKGELTTKGKKKIEKLKRRMKSEILQPQPQPQSQKNSQLQGLELYKVKEQQQISKAKSLRKYDYLSKHLTNNNSTIMNTTTANNNSSLFVTANNIFPNTSQMNNSQYFPNTFLNNTTINDTTLQPNVSILGGFGNGIVGESTPFGTPFSSPGKKGIKKPGLSNIPKGLLELRELTQGIKRKYAS